MGRFRINAEVGNRIIRAAHVKGSRWLDLDQEFRLKAAAQGNWKWSIRDVDLWDYHVTAAAGTNQETCGFQHTCYSCEHSDHAARECAGGQKTVEK